MNDEIKPRAFFNTEWNKALLDIEINKFSANIDRIIPWEREVKVVYKLPLVKNPGKSIESTHIISTLFSPDDKQHGMASHLAHIGDIYAEHEKDQRRLGSINTAPNNED